MATAADVRAFERVTKAAAADVAALPAPILAALQPAIDAAHAEIGKGIGAWLATIDDPTVRYTAREYKTTLRYLKPAFALITKMSAAIASALVDGAATAGDLAAQHLDEQIAAIAAEHDVPGAMVSVETQKALAKQFRTNAAASMAGLIDEIRATLACGVVAKETIEQLVTRLESLDPEAQAQLGIGDWIRRAAAAAKAIARGIASRASAWVDRVVTTETVDAYAQSFGDAMDAAAKSVPDLKRRWDASNDACPICKSMHGQIRDLDKPFESSDSAPAHTSRSIRGQTKFDAPPVHPRCACVVTVFRPGYD